MAMISPRSRFCFSRRPRWSPCGVVRWDFPSRTVTPALILGGLLGASLSFATPALAQSWPFDPPVTRLLLAQGSSLEQAWDFYRQQQYEAAIDPFQAAIAADPTNPKPHWGLTLVYNKLQQYPEAQAALDQAVALDPMIGFTSAESYNSLRTTIEKNLAQAGASVGRSPASATAPAAPTAPSPAPTATASPRPSGVVERQELIAALAQGSTYVAPALVANVAQDDLDRAAQALQPFAVKFVVVPAVQGTRQAYAQEIFEYLNLTDGVVIVNTERGVDLYTSALSPAEAEQLVKASLPTFTARDYTSGLVQLAQSVQQAVANAAATPATAADGSSGGASAAQSAAPDAGSGSQRLLGLALAGLVVLGAGVTLMNRRRQGQTRRKLADLQDLHYRVSAQLEDVKNYQAVVPQGPETATVSRSIDQATEQFLQASDLLDQSPPTAAQLQQLETSLQSATAALNQAHAALDRATGQSSAETPSPDTHGTCFFCSRPLALDLLQPRILDLQPRSKRVLCCPPCAAQVDQKTPPKVRTIKEGDRDRPWYRSASYNPYRDYYRYDRTWYRRSAPELELEFWGDDDRDLQQVIIFADQAQYRDYQVQQVEQGQFWEEGASGAAVPPEDSLEASLGEAPAETDFFWTDAPAEPELDPAEPPEVADFFSQDPS
ncbi:MAG: tetratricopeptide repeat protein [Prochlorothrix sp.]|nr:tetratricopeptide repeat protein [Prochlorothrix sp.]